MIDAAFNGIHNSFTGRWLRVSASRWGGGGVADGGVESEEPPQMDLL